MAEGRGEGTLESIQRINQLVAQRLPVQVQGVITYADPGWQHFFIQDFTGGIYVRSWQQDLRAGQWVEVSDWTAPGKLVRMLVNASVRQLGPPHLPAPVRVSVPERRLPANESRWVALEGVVLSLSSVPARLTLETQPYDLVLKHHATNSLACGTPAKGRPACPARPNNPRHAGQDFP